MGGSQVTGAAVRVAPERGVLREAFCQVRVAIGCSQVSGAVQG